jgi:hypothetical protein
MQRRSRMITASLLTASLTALSALGCSSTNDGGGGDPKCKALTSYTASSGNLVNYMTDIYPILASTDVTTGGCAQVTICHGVNPSGLDSLTNPTKFLQFLYEPANPGMARTNLLTASVNAPGMQRVAPGSVQDLRSNHPRLRERDVRRGCQHRQQQAVRRRDAERGRGADRRAADEDPRLDRPGRRELGAPRR